jgi:hypothetical protein
MLVDEAPRVGALGSVRVDSEAVLGWVEMDPWKVSRIKLNLNPRSLQVSRAASGTPTAYHRDSEEDLEVMQIISR